MQCNAQINDLHKYFYFQISLPINIFFSILKSLNHWPANSGEFGKNLAKFSILLPKSVTIFLINRALLVLTIYNRNYTYLILKLCNEQVILWHEKLSSLQEI